MSAVRRLCLISLAVCLFLGMFLVVADAAPKSKKKASRFPGVACLSNDDIATRSCGGKEQCGGKHCASGWCDARIGKKYSAKSCQKFCCDH
ncbi:hypothetical protein BV898_11791 [Hypsibius exemplaris]|uniref:Invertebrate defensins family profile domain-containing protein n=1 Tax=Hypsibius exemplaris TaxID=2072580 RepID=A0A1W0WFM8_HYPEX|nr:hypothetical protein BV898_11791 [Hypsibius exemplaris]